MDLSDNVMYSNSDCMDLMRVYNDNYFDIAIVDPPYFSGPERRKFYGKAVSTKSIKRVNYPVSDKWMVPGQAYFDELFRVSKNQIIWGCNYFNKVNLPVGRIIWDKCNGVSSFSDAEIAATSFHDSVRMFKYMWNGMMQGKSILEGDVQQGNKGLNEKRIHPTQKPVKLYKWLLSTYAESGDQILDTHGGSGSSMIACYDMGFDLTWTEIDENHYNRAVLRYEAHRLQLKLPI